MIGCVFGGFTTGLQIGETCNFRLWVVLLLDFFDDIVNPPQLQEAVAKARSSLKEEGFQNDGSVFLAGHSLGGTLDKNLRFLVFDSVTIIQMQFVKYEYYENSKYQLLIKNDKIT